MIARFDAYTATTTAVDRDAMRTMLLQHQAQSDEWRDGDGYHGFERKESFRGSDGSEWASLLYGGRQAERVMVEVKGERSPEIVNHLREVSPQHRCTRVDSCVDFDEQGAWDRLLEQSLDIKTQFRIYGEKRGDWDMPEKGRTLMLGAPTSAVRARVYEKGKQAHLLHLAKPDLVRAEVQVRPIGTARETYAKIGPQEVWGASPYVRELASRLLGLKLASVPAGTVYREPMRERALRWMCKQYGPHLLSLRQDLGDWECVGRQFEAYIADAKRTERHKKG